MHVCSVCGSEVVQANGKKGGRPREYCSKSCREMENYWLAFEKIYRDKDMKQGSISNWKNRMFSIMNEKR